jgi:hypothetical protein
VVREPRTYSMSTAVVYPVLCEECMRWIGRVPRDEVDGLIAIHEASTHGRSSVRVTRPEYFELVPSRRDDG